MMKLKSLTALGTFVCFGVTLCAQDRTLSHSSLEGPWRLQSLTMNGKEVPATGYMVFHGDHYTFITNMERPSLLPESGRKPLDQLSESEKDLFVEAFRSMTAAAGPYSIQGDHITYVMEVVRTPYLTGRTEKRKSWFEGNRLIQDFEGGRRHRVMVWEKVTSGASPH